MSDSERKDRDLEMAGRTDQGSGGRRSPTGSEDSIGSAGSLDDKPDSPLHSNRCDEENRYNSEKNEKKIDALRGQKCLLKIT